MKRNKLIIWLLSIGLILFGIVHFVILPEMAQKEEQYIKDQEDPLTHDIESIRKYKNKYMGNAANLTNLFRALPRNKEIKSFQLYTDRYACEVIYKDTVLNIGQTNVNSAIIYNATAAFALIENLKEIHFTFVDVTYRVKRQDLERWYGKKAESLTDQETWRKEVQGKISDQSYVTDFINQRFHKEQNSGK